MTILCIDVHELTHDNSSRFSLCKTTTTKMVFGGLGETKPATPEIQKIVDEVKPQFEKKCNEKYDCFEAVNYRRQVVAGSVYYVKVHYDGDRCAHLKIFEPLPCKNESLELLDYQTGKTKNDEMKYF
ncbi:cystatin-A-like, partial [Trichosurus vulpecula]|uniref:cystatin-A-like n=1 Tax=Trichosurus vulpecula TaxID=9337 RepID=UPI00186B560E